MWERTSERNKKRKLTTKATRRSGASFAHSGENAAELSRLRELVSNLERASPVATSIRDDSQFTVKSEHGSSGTSGTDGFYDFTPPLEVAENDRREQNASNSEEPLESQSSPQVTAQSAVEFKDDVRGEVSHGHVCLYSGMRMPTVVRRFPPILDLQLPPQPNTKFPAGFLKSILGGEEGSNGWYKSEKSGRAFPNVDSYVLLNREFEPLLPRRPGEHGTQVTPYIQSMIVEKLSLFIRDVTDVGDADLGLRYYGTYEAIIPSDRLGHNDMIELPEDVKRHWARNLGTLPANGVKSSQTVDALKDMWAGNSTGDFTIAEANDITEDEIMAAFCRHDFGNPPGVPIFYEYLKCVGYDSELYEGLVTKMHEL